MKTFRVLLCVAMLALTTVGCRSTQGVSPTPSQTERHDYTVMTFTGMVDGMSVSGQVRTDKDRVIWCSVNKFIELGRAMATTDSIWVRVPMLNRYQQGNYDDLSRLAQRRITFTDLQAILESDDVERRVTELARQLGMTVTIKITKKEKAETLTFPFNK